MRSPEFSLPWKKIRKLWVRRHNIHNYDVTTTAPTLVCSRRWAHACRCRHRGTSTRTGATSAPSTRRCTRPTTCGPWPGTTRSSGPAPGPRPRTTPRRRPAAGPGGRPPAATGGSGPRPRRHHRRRRGNCWHPWRTSGCTQTSVFRFAAAVVVIRMTWWSSPTKCPMTSMTSCYGREDRSSSPSLSLTFLRSVVGTVCMVEVVVVCSFLLFSIHQGVYVFTIIKLAVKNYLHKSLTFSLWMRKIVASIVKIATFSFLRP